MTLLTTAYADLILALKGPDDDSWDGVPTIVPTEREPICVCGSRFRSEFELQLHLQAAALGSAHDVPPERRPRIGMAYILADLHERYL